MLFRLNSNLQNLRLGKRCSYFGIQLATKVNDLAFVVGLTALAVALYNLLASGPEGRLFLGSHTRAGGFSRGCHER